MPPDPDPYLGATIDGVAHFVPGLTITNTGKPSIADVTAFIALVAGTVDAHLARRLAAVDALAVRGVIAAADAEAWLDRARQLVELGAASFTFDAAHPELAAASETNQRYGAVLWGRFTDGLVSLADQVDAFLADHETQPGGDEGGPGVSGPLVPLFRRDQRW